VIPIRWRWRIRRCALCGGPHLRREFTSYPVHETPPRPPEEVEAARPEKYAAWEHDAMNEELRETLDNLTKAVAQLGTDARPETIRTAFALTVDALEALYERVQDIERVR
jgi:hypothetical protein